MANLTYNNKSIKSQKEEEDNSFQIESKLPELSIELIEHLARNVHHQWMAGRIADGWQYGSTRDDEKKEHPSLVSYEELSEAEKEYDRQTVLITIRGLIECGFEIVKK